MAAVLIGLREGLEAALIVGILLGALHRLGKPGLARFVWLGVIAAIIVSFIGAAGLVVVGVQFEGRAEQIFEGVTLIAAAGFLTGMIVWMKRQGAALRAGLEADVTDAARTANEGGRAWGLAIIAFLAVVREGLELALLLVATSLEGGLASTALGALLGIAGAVLLGALLYQGVLRLDLARFFRFTNVVLLLFAAGMVGLGIHELIEASMIPAVVDPVWNINWLLSDQSSLGGLLKALFGYNGNPALTEVIGYLAYLVVVGWLILAPTRRKAVIRAA